ncbi:MAG: T9SS type A sorting domain-containing protein [bacterium]
MKKVFGFFGMVVGLGIFTAPEIVNAQTLETTIYLPESNSAIVRPTALFNYVNNKLYIGGGNNNRIVVIDGSTNMLLPVIDIPGGTTPYTYYSLPMFLNPTGNKLYCSRYGYSTAFTNVIDCATNTLKKTIPYYGEFYAFNSTNNKIYANGSDTVFILDGVGDTLIKKMALPFSTGLTWNPVSNRVYCNTRSSAQNMRIIDGVGDTVFGTLPVIYNNGIVCNNIDNKAYCPSSNCLYVIDGVTDVITDSIVTGGCLITWNPKTDKIYASRNNDNGILIIDCKGDTIIDSLPTSSHPYIWLCDTIENQIYFNVAETTFVLDSKTDVIASQFHFNVGYVPVKWNPVENKYYRFYVGHSSYNPNSDNVKIMDGFGDTLITDKLLGVWPSALLWHSKNNKVYCLSAPDSTYIDGHIAVIDGATNLPIKALKIKGFATAFVWNSTNDKIYIGHDRYGGIEVLDCATDSIVDTISTGLGAIYAMVWDSVYNKIYCGNYYNLVVIDGASNTITKNMAVGSGIMAWNPVSSKLYCSGYGSIKIIDLPADTIMGSLDFWNGDIAVNTSNNKVYCSAYDSLVVIDGKGDTVITTLHNPYGNGKLAYNSTNNKIYYAINDTTMIIDCAGDTVIKTIPVGISYNNGYDYCCGSIFWDSKNNSAYLTNSDSEVTVIDGKLDKVLTSLKVGTSPCAFALNQTNNRIYVANYHSSNLTVISGIIGIEENAPQPGWNVATLQITKNPFIKSTLISYQIPLKGKVSLKLYDISGSCVKTLINEEKTAGTYNITLNAKELKTGVYFVRLTVGGNKETKKLILMK